MRSWRYDTLCAISSNVTVDATRTRQIQAIGGILFVELCTVFPGLLGESAGSFLQDIVIPAAKLEKEVHLSTTRYEFIDEQQTMLGEVSLIDMKNASWLDVRTRRTISPANKMLTSDGGGCVGESLLQIERGLLRVNQDQRRTVLRPPKYVMELYGSAPKRVKVVQWVAQSISVVHFRASAPN